MDSVLATLSSVYEASKGNLEFQGKIFGNYTSSINGESSGSADSLKGLENAFSLLRAKRRNNNTENKVGQVSFIVDGDGFSCRIELSTKDSFSHDEYQHIQELIKDKISRCLLDKMSKMVRATFQSAELPWAITNDAGKAVYKNESFTKNFLNSDETKLAKRIAESIESKKNYVLVPQKGSYTSEDENLRKVMIREIGEGLFSVVSPDEPIEAPSTTGGRFENLLLDAIDDLNIGVAILEKDEHRQSKEFKIVSINKAFYRIFGLAGSNAQLEEVDEILSTAVRPDERKDFSGQPPATDFFYMRRDGLKIRARLTLVKAEENSLVVVFEPVENAQRLTSSYRQLIDAAQILFKTGDVRSYLKELREVTRSDGITLAKKCEDSPSFEITDKAGFVINIPKLIFEDLATRDLINYQGYLVVPMKHRGKVTGALVALRPSEEETELVVAGARILEAQEIIQEEIHEIHFQIAKIASEAQRADNANRSKSEFLANMSHEIRTPLNSVLGFANIIHDEAPELSPELLHEFSGNIVTAGNHLLSLINDILDLAKVETGRMGLDPQKFSINEVVEGINRMLKPLLDTKRIQLDVKIEESLQTFVADPVKFKQILYNLLNNAITYSSHNSAVRLEIVKSVDGIEMKVIDNGIGIKRGDLDKLFRPFVQLSRENGGTGLGLVLTKRLVELHHGAIWIDSTFGVGTTVVVYLPEYNLSNFNEQTELTRGRFSVPQKSS
jgi:signal transduction histidine kinase